MAIDASAVMSVAAEAMLAYSDGLSKAGIEAGTDAVIDGVALACPAYAPFAPIAKFILNIAIANDLSGSPDSQTQLAANGKRGS